MALDRQLSADFWLHEFPCYGRASEADVRRLEETVQRVLQPVRSRFGVTVPTSWMWWRDGCTRRTGSHAHGGTVDFVTLDAPLRDVFSWGVQHLLPAGYLSRWIYEPERRDQAGRKIQGEHLHAAPLADMLAAFAIGDIGAFVELDDGTYQPAASITWDGATGAYGDPIEIPGLVASVPYNWGRWLAAGVLVRLAWRRHAVTP